MIRGKKGTKVELQISRGNAASPIKVTITRDTIPIETVYSEMLEDGIAKIQVTSFSDNTTKELTTAITDMQSKGMKGMILDLRGNPGGLLDQAIDIASIFVPDGQVVLQVEDRNGKKEVYKSNNKEILETPVVVLIDKGSASASEIVAAAVSESAGIQLVGEKTFGKGTVQTAQEYTDGSNFKFTAAKWLTPKGTWIHKKGVEPDTAVSLPDYANLAYISPDKELKESDSSEEVKTAKQMLEAEGYDVGEINTLFDETMKQAVLKFQSDQKLEQTGILKGETTLKLMEMLRQMILDHDTQVQKAQEMLKAELK